MEQEEKGPGGPWTDYSRSQNSAEEVVGLVVEQIMNDGGTMLWQKYLERKAFGFATAAAKEALISQLNMCYVTHDPGEEDGFEDWELEDEPEPSIIDKWARMHLPVRRSIAGEGAVPGTGASSKTRGGTGMSRSQQGLRSRTSDTRARGPARADKAEKKVETRSTPLPDNSVWDEDEEALREAKNQEEARRRERERRGRESEKQQAEDQRLVLLRHEEMRLRQHTFDQDGGIIWVEELKIERLPKVQEAATYAVKKELKGANRTGGLDETIRSTMTTTSSKQDAPASNSGAMKSSRTRPRGKQRSKQPKVAQEPEFTDGFSKLQHGQPPILETIVVATGVTCQTMGKSKTGAPDNAESRTVMSRKEYNRLAERESGDMEYRAGATGGFPGADAGKPDDAGQPPTPGGGAPGDGDSPAGQGGGGLPPIKGGGRPGGPDGVPLQRAPLAPPQAVRHMGKKFEAMGALAFQRAPRYHVPALGGPQGYGSAQPPLGATMGHGLVRHGSLKEEYFFPPTLPEIPMSLLRSASDASLMGPGGGSGRRHGASTSARGPGGGSTPKGGGTPKGAHSKVSKEFSRELGANGSAVLDEEGHGMMRAETSSPAYRNFRHQLHPEPTGNSGGSFGTVGGYGSRY